MDKPEGYLMGLLTTYMIGKKVKVHNQLPSGKKVSPQSPTKTCARICVITQLPNDLEHR